MNWPNFISISRLGLAAIAILWLLIKPTPTMLVASAVLTLLVIALDGLDGYVARKLNQATPSGAVIDILADRSVEMIYWITFATLGWVTVLIPMIVCIRGIWVDGIRALALQQGYTAFGSTSMMQHPLAILLTSSRFSRWTYAALKAVVFIVVILAQHPLFCIALQPWATGLCWASVIFCLLRGIPVFTEGVRFLNPPKA